MDWNLQHNIGASNAITASYFNVSEHWAVIDGFSRQAYYYTRIFNQFTQKQVAKSITSIIGQIDNKLVSTDSILVEMSSGSSWWIVREQRV